jgi:cell division control protein 7
VYKAVDLLHDTIDNSDWCSHCKAAKQLPTPDATSSDQDSLSYIMGKRKRDIADDGGCTRSKKTKPSKICVAMKRIYVTSSPIRILNELDILNTLRCDGSYCS